MTFLQIDNAVWDSSWRRVCSSVEYEVRLLVRESVRGSVADTLRFNIENFTDLTLKEYEF